MTDTEKARLNGLAPQVQAVEAARAKLGTDLQRLTVEVRAQMSQTMEKTAWKVVGTGAAIVTGVAVRKAVIAGWRKARKVDPPANPAAWETTWGEALAWSAATGIAVGIGRLVATRGAAAGWQKAMGRLPPGLQDVTP